MAVSTMSRCVPGSSAATLSRRSHAHSSTTRPVQATSFVRASRPRTTTASASYRAGGWNDGSADPMLNFMNDVAKAWKAQSGYSYNRSRCNPGYSSPGGSSHTAQRKPSLPYDVIQNETAYMVLVDIPGLAKPDLKIRVSNNKSDKVQGASPRMLTISGERQAPLQEGYVQKQRLFGGFENVWELPADAETEGISAKVTDGVLTVTVPKKQQQAEVDDSQEIFIS